MPQWFDDLAAALVERGLVPRGAFHPGPEDAVPGDAGTLVLAGNAGQAMWDAFVARRPAGPDPLDAWSRNVLDAVAKRVGAVALFPFGEPPYLPFQRWAMKAEAVHPSPLGILIHPDYGLWHGYRGALAFANRRDLPPRDDRPSPCESCAGRPCLSACPVDAFTVAGYDVDACAAFLERIGIDRTHDRLCESALNLEDRADSPDWRIAEGESTQPGSALGEPDGADCMAFSCRARRACPVGRDYIYPPDQAAFHMAAFLRGRRPAPADIET